MQRLIKDAAALDSSIDANSMSFANIVKAINVVQTEMGITGTTAKEAASTIQGSVGMMKSSWANLVTGIADENANLDVLITNFVDSVGTVAQNIVPKIGVALNSASKLISDLIPVIVQEIPVLIEENLPILAEAAISIIKSLVDGISENQEMLMETAFDTIKYLAESLLEMLPEIIQVGIDLIFSLIDGITEMISDPVFVQSIIDVILKIVDILTNPGTITKLLNAAVTIIVALAKGLIQALPQLLAKVPEIINNLVKAFGQFLQPMDNVGKNIVEGIKKGISNAWKNLVSWFRGLFGDLIGIAKKILGIASPSKVFKKIGGFTAEGFGAGFEDEFAHVKDDMEDALNFDDASVGINASIRKVGAGAAGGAFGGTSIGNITINIDGAKYSDEQNLAAAIALELQNMTDRRAAVYA
jgi:phage-related protein